MYAPYISSATDEQEQPAPPSSQLTSVQFIQDSTTHDALPSTTPAPLPRGEFDGATNVPDVPDLYATWHAQRRAINALGIMAVITMLVRFVPGVLGLFSAAAYYADAWTASLCQRAKVCISACCDDDTLMTTYDAMQHPSLMRITV